MDHYDIAVQRWPLPWMSRYRVIQHFWNDDETKLTLVKTTGDAFSFPRMDRRALRVYPNYKSFMESSSPQPALVSADPIVPAALEPHLEGNPDGSL